MFIISLFALSDRLFIALRNEDIKEGMKLVLRLFSIIMTVYLFIF